MADWADAEAKELVLEYEEALIGNIAFLDAIAAALRQAKAEARQAENEKCRELIGARVGETKYQGA